MSLKRKVYSIISCLAVLIWMGVIFYMSAQTADDSSEMSNALLLWIQNALGAELSSFLIRKAAHATEFALLAMLLYNFIKSVYRNRFAVLISLPLTVLYAVTDEIHQLFVPGRACRFTDVLIDSAGAVLGTLAAVIIYKLIKIIAERRNKNGSTQSI